MAVNRGCTCPLYRGSTYPLYRGSTCPLYRGSTCRYLTGNPCTDYNGYRDYVIATLTQLEMLDGKEITRSERILAAQVRSLYNGCC